MPTKISILSAKLSDKLRLNGARRLYYHLGRPNFGDDVNPWFFNKVSTSSFAWGATSRSHVMGIGSIAAKVSPHSIVMGSGLIEHSRSSDLAKPVELFSVRGELTAEAFGKRPSFLGDPLSLIDLLLPLRVADSSDVLGIVPHILNYHLFKRHFESRPEVLVINPGGEPVEVISAISRCRRIASQSLHGLIVADAYGIPNTWIAPSIGMLGGTFKFLDYFTTLDKPKTPVALKDFTEDFENLDYTLGRYIHNKQMYLTAMKNRLADTNR